MVPAQPNSTAEETASYPPPFPCVKTANRPVLIKSLYSIVLYLGLGYLLLRRWDILLVILGVVVIHEAGHFWAMKHYRYADVSVLFLPFIGAFVKGSKKEISQKQSAVIYLAGPLPGILLGLIGHIICQAYPSLFLGRIPVQLIAQLLIWTNLLNLLPIYPLDGGQLLNRVFLNEEGRASNIFFLISMGIIAGIAIFTKFYILLLFPAFFIYRFLTAKSHLKLEEEIERSGADINKEYEELSPEDYWKIRSALIRYTPALQGIAIGPPYQYHDKEERIAEEIAHLLQRNLLLDISMKEKITVIAIWVLFLLLPWILSVEFLLLRYFVR